MTQKVVFWPRYRHDLLAAYDNGELDAALRDLAEAVRSWADPDVERVWDFAIQLADHASAELREHFALLMARELDTMAGDEPADAGAFLRARLEAMALDLRVRKAALDARENRPSTRERIQRQQSEVATRLRELYAERARRAIAAARRVEQEGGGGPG